MTIRRPPPTASRDDNDGTFIYYATIAARNEASCSHSTAESFWLKAMRVAVKPINREWAGRRAAMCKQLATKWIAKPMKAHRRRRLWQWHRVSGNPPTAIGDKSHSQK